MDITKRFLSYVAFDTRSQDDAGVIPSTQKQFALANAVAEELKQIGLTDVKVDEHCYVYGTLEANVEGQKTIGLISHLDTSPEMSGENIKPSIIEYGGGDIVLNRELGIIMTEQAFPCLKNYVGKHLIVTDGTTLLGADDKAGVAEIVSAVEYIIANDLPHGRIKVAFTPDEEVGCGADMFDVKAFGCDYAYTVDGGAVGEIEYENFNAASANITINGASIHPGSAKNKMINALTVAMQFDRLLPDLERPQHTEGYEGFYHLHGMQGGVEHAEMKYIIRDHDMKLFEQRKQNIERVAEYLNGIYGEGTVEINMRDSYYNMKEKILPHIYIVEKLQKAMRECGVDPIITPIRGGTDGARLSYMGLPCPNMCTGGENFHGKYEFVAVESLEKCRDIIIKLVTDVK